MFVETIVGRGLALVLGWANGDVFVGGECRKEHPLINELRFKVQKVRTRVRAAVIGV